MERLLAARPLHVEHSRQLDQPRADARLLDGARGSRRRRSQPATDVDGVAADHPSSGRARQASGHRRSHQQRPGGDGPRRGMAGQRASRLRLRAPRAGRASHPFHRGHSCHPRTARQRALQLRRSVVHVDGRDVRAQAGAIASADPRRNKEPADVAHRGALRECLEHVGRSWIGRHRHRAIHGGMREGVARPSEHPAIGAGPRLHHRQRCAARRARRQGRWRPGHHRFLGRGRRRDGSVRGGRSRRVRAPDFNLGVSVEQRRDAIERFHEEVVSQVADVRQG